MPSTIANGIRIEYEHFGRATDPALVLIIGFGLQMTAWPDSLCRGLADQGFCVIRLDNRDTGLSQQFNSFGSAEIGDAFARLEAGEPFDAPYTEEDLVDDVAGLLDALDIAQAHIVGMSMGGCIAQRFALRYPTRVSSLVVLMSTTGAPGLPEGDPEVRKVLFSEPEVPGSLDSLISLSVKIQRALRGPRFAFDQDAFQIRVAQDLARCPEIDGYKRCLLGMRAASPYYEQLMEITVPTLVLHGRDDPVLPYACGQDIANRISSAKMIILEGWGHEVFSTEVHPFLIDAIARHCFPLN